MAQRLKLVISLATRGRPQQLIETITRSTANLVLPNTVFMVQVDEDDKATIEALGKAALDERIKVNVRPREDTIAEKWNRALEEPGDLYLVAADDDPYITPGYDAKLCRAAELFPDGIGMVYGRMANASFSGVVAPTRGLTEKLGHIFPEWFPYWFVDHWTDDLAKLIGRISFADVRTDQTNVGKTQEMREPGWWATFFDAGYMVRRKIAFGIIDALDEPEWRKEMLRNQAPLIEYRSRWINDGVRSRDAELSNWSGLDTSDPRYCRVRDAAVALIPEFLDGMDKDEAETFRKALYVPRLVDAAWGHDEERLKAILGQWRS
jgi:hypothetical protein